MPAIRKHLILGTAGHIDHGKTALVKALTGIDCDTHPEEKARGITIHLGFAHLDLPTGERIGVVDVPGHAAFVRTMVSGASGIDIALLVVAADEGVMPQTREHVQILQVLGVKRGIVALNKADLVDPETLALAAEDVQEIVAGTLFQDAPVIPVSARTGAGLDRLKQAIGAMAQAVSERPRGEVFRMFVDRVFTVKGFGTVVTGSVLSGRLATESAAWLLPRGTELRVRRVEQFGEEVAQVVAGDRASLNLVGLSPSDFQRGMLVSDRPLRTTALVDALLTLFAHAREFGLWTQVSFHVGTYEAQARVHLIDRERLAGGQSGLVQIHLPSPCVLQAGDRFVVRSSSSDTTLGGGEIIDAFPLHHRKRRPDVVATMAKLAGGQRSELVAAEIRKRMAPVSCAVLGDILNLSEHEVAAVVREGLPTDVVVYESDNHLALHRRDVSVAWAEKAVKAIASHHRRNPLERRGLRVREVAGAVGAPLEPVAEAVLTAVLEGLVAEGRLKKVDDTYALREHDVVVTPELERRIAFVSGYLAAQGMKAPLYAELVSAAAREGLDEKELHRVLRYLVAARKVYHIEDTYLDGATVDKCREQLVAELRRKPEGVTVAGFRDLVNGNRKICLLMLAQFDAEGTTVRKGDLRVLAGQGTR